MADNVTSLPLWDLYNWTNKWSTFCSYETDVVCADVPLYKCDTCSQFGFWIFFVLAFLLAVWILVGYLHVIAYVITSNRTNLGYIRASLAVSEIMTSILIFSVTLPSIVWTLKSTSWEIWVGWQTRKNTLEAAFGGAFFMFCISSFLFHLAFLSYNRFAAVRWPLRTKMEKKRSVFLKLGLVWLLSAVPASYPSWFPQSYNHAYMYFTFLYTPYIRVDNADTMAIAFGTIMFYIAAYLIMTVFTVGTGILIRRNRKNRLRLAQSTKQRTAVGNSERSSYKMLTLLEIVFTLCSLPAFFAYSLAYTGFGISILTLFGNYIMMCNGAMNLVIYLWKDKDFEKFLKQSYSRMFHKLASCFRKVT